LAAWLQKEGQTLNPGRKSPVAARSWRLALRHREVKSMNEELSRLGRREQQIVDLLLQGCDNSEIARNLNMAERTVKAYFNRMFLQFGIKDGIKRVKLATLLYRRQLWLERRQASGTPDAGQVNANISSSSA
jgi:DNA-binding NarL/FixJ family response regulator